MSLQPQDIPPVPDLTATTTRAAFPRGNRYMAMRDELGTIYTDHEGAALFPSRGQSALAPWRLALVLVFQFVENLSDEQAADAVRARLDWKYALSLELHHAGFDSSVLSEFRDRLVTGSLELHLLDAMLVRFKALGLLRSRGRQRTDSTHVLAAVRALNRLQGVGETMRHALNVLAVAAPNWLTPLFHPEWVARYGQRFDEYRLPTAKPERQVLAEQIGTDGRSLLVALYAADAPSHLRELAAVQTLRRMWLQHYHAVAPVAPMRWRTAEELPPTAQNLNSPYDVEARFSNKRTTEWVGYKVHLTETCEQDSPHLVTHVLTTEATVPDYQAPEQIHQALATKQLLPAEHIVDAGYTDADNLVRSKEQQIDLLGPVATNQQWQMRAQEGFEVGCFSLDWTAQKAVCPQGQTSCKWSATHTTRGDAIINIRFARSSCQGCASRSQCTRSASGPREITVRPQAHHEALQAARKRQKSVDFKAEYDIRAGVEGTISQAVRVSDMRRCRYIGLAKTRLQHILTAAALNVRLFGEWVSETPLARTRTDAFVKLMTPSP